MIKSSSTTKCLLALTIMITFSHFAKAATQVNLAQKAAIVVTDASKTDIGRLTDNNRNLYWSSYTTDAMLGQYSYVEFQWTATCKIAESIIYWAPESGNIMLPDDAYLEYYDGSKWVKGDAIGAPNSSNISDDNVTIETKRLRIYMKSAKACGLREVRLLGFENVRPGEPFTWPDYSCTFDYNYRYDYPNGVPAPTKFLPENNGQVGKKISGWWAFAWGKNKNRYVTDAAIDGILERMNEEFGYFRDSLGWLPDKRAREGYYSTIYLYGSGCYSDNASISDRGGWQGATWYNGESWPMVNLSYYPVACFDSTFVYDSYYSSKVTDAEAQQSACVHEGIHAVFADLEGCKNAAWFQESGNTSMQADAELSKTPNATPESMGYLSAGNMIAPFIPIECYSGWLLDGSFGGPSAEGVNMYNGSQQICTWKNLLGGYQYGELFAHFLDVRFGNGALPWIWRYCKDRVLVGLADSIGENQARRLVLEYRAKQAMIDFGKWSVASRQLINNNWLLSVKQEWSPYWMTAEEWKATPYAKMEKCDEVDSLGWWKPEYRTTPGWSGANQIPLHVSGNEGDTIKVHFKPLGDNMVCQLCYRTKRGKIYYSQPCYGEGDVVMSLENAPANKVVLAVVCNTDYIYKGEETRKAHYDYRLQMLDNVYAPGSSQLKWYNYSTTINDKTFNESDYTGIEQVMDEQTEGAKFALNVDKTIVHAGEALPIHLTAASQLMVQLRLFTAEGTNIYNQSFMRDGDFMMPDNLTPGMYILSAKNGKESSSVKLIVRK